MGPTSPGILSLFNTQKIYLDSFKWCNFVIWFQVHVLCYTVYVILKNISSELKPGDLDNCRQSLQEVRSFDLSQYTELLDFKNVVWLFDRCYAFCKRVIVAQQKDLSAICLSVCHIFLLLAPQVFFEYQVVVFDALSNLFLYDATVVTMWSFTRCGTLPPFPVLAL